RQWRGWRRYTLLRLAEEKLEGEELRDARVRRERHVVADEILRRRCVEDAQRTWFAIGACRARYRNARRDDECGSTRKHAMITVAHGIAAGRKAARPQHGLQRLTYHPGRRGQAHK